VLALFPDARRDLVDDGWEDRWRDFHRPALVRDLWVGPPWEEPPRGLTPVVVDPGRAFGTGGHPTTRLCLEFLLDLPHGAFLDVGCGSGVLAIAAALLGYAPVIAVDAEPAAVDAARANAAANGVELDVREVDALAEELPAAAVVVANIALEAIVALAPRVSTRFFVTSGYLASDTPELAGFTGRERRELDGWAADLFVCDGGTVDKPLRTRP
jgi:ribosomal protein L11 methyltransferase